MSAHAHTSLRNGTAWRTNMMPGMISRPPQPISRCNFTESLGEKICSVSCTLDLGFFASGAITYTREVMTPYFDPA